MREHKYLTSRLDEAPVRLRASVSPEAQLLLACARTSVNSETAERIRLLLQKNLDWPYVFEKAHRNCVLPLLYWNLNDTCPEAVPTDILSRLQAYFRDHAQHNLRRTREMLGLVRLFESGGIPALPFKGPMLAAFVYGNISLRQFGDLDILIHKRNILKAKDLLIERGYRLWYPLIKAPRWVQSLSLLSRIRKKDLSFVSHDGRVRVELHSRLTGRYFAFPLNLKRLWGRLDSFLLAGSAVRNLPPKDLLLYLCMHGSRHGWERLEWICDVAEVIRVHPDIDWEELIEEARVLGSKRALALGLFLASDLLGTALPEVVWQTIPPDLLIRSLAADVRESLFRNTDVPSGISNWYRYHLRLKELWRHRVRLHLHYCYRYLRIAIKPNVRDHALLPLPAFLSFFYWLLRPTRLAKEYGMVLSERLIKKLSK